MKKICTKSQDEEELEEDWKGGHFWYEFVSEDEEDFEEDEEEDIRVSLTHACTRCIYLI